MKERKPRISFCSSVKTRSTRQSAEANARGPPNSRSIMTKTMTGQLIGEKNAAGSNRPMSQIDFQLPPPPMTKPRTDKPLRSGLSSNHQDLGSNDNVLIVRWLI